MKRIAGEVCGDAPMRDAALNAMRREDGAHVDRRRYLKALAQIRRLKRELNIALLSTVE